MSMRLSLVVIFVIAYAVHHVTASMCVCNQHVELAVFPCPDYSQMPVGFMYADNDANPCIVQEDRVVAPPGWYAGIYTDPFVTQIVYLKADYQVSLQTCSLTRPKGKISYNAQCTRVVPGALINPTTPKTTTSTTTTSTTTTTTTTTTTPTPTTTSTTPTTTTTTTTPKPIPPGSVSTKCDHTVIQQHIHAKTNAVHNFAKACPDGTHSSMFAPLYESCNNIETDYTLWNQGQRVLDVCTTIPRGEPIAFYLFGNPAGLVGMFWSCLPGNSFQIAIQNCGSALRILDIAAQPAFDKNNFYMVSW